MRPKLRRAPRKAFLIAAGARPHTFFVVVDFLKFCAADFLNRSPATVLDLTPKVSLARLLLGPAKQSLTTVLNLLEYAA